MASATRHLLSLRAQAMQATLAALATLVVLAGSEECFGYCPSSSSLHAAANICTTHDVLSALTLNKIRFTGISPQATDFTLHRQGLPCTVLSLAKPGPLDVRSVSWQPLGDDGVKELAMALRAMRVETGEVPTLQLFDLRGNSFAANGAAELAKLLYFGYIRISALDIRGCDVPQLGAMLLATALEQSAHIHSFWATFIHVNDDTRRKLVRRVESNLERIAWAEAADNAAAASVDIETLDSLGSTGSKFVGQAHVLDSIKHELEKKLHSRVFKGPFVMMLNGPPGCGKTQLAELTAEIVHEKPFEELSEVAGDGRFLMYNMGQFTSELAANNLFGAHVGYQGDCKLCEALRKHPDAVVFFDELEKGHADVVKKALLTMLEGTITSNQGGATSTKGATFVFATNLEAHTLYCQADGKLKSNALIQRSTDGDILEQGKTFETQLGKPLLDRIGGNNFCLLQHNDATLAQIAQLVLVKMRDDYQREFGSQLLWTSRTPAQLVAMAKKGRHGDVSARFLQKSYIQDLLWKYRVETDMKKMGPGSRVLLFTIGDALQVSSLGGNGQAAGTNGSCSDSPPPITPGTVPAEPAIPGSGSTSAESAFASGRTTAQAKPSDEVQQMGIDAPVAKAAAVPAKKAADESMADEAARAAAKAIEAAEKRAAEAADEAARAAAEAIEAAEKRAAEAADEAVRAAAEAADEAARAAAKAVEAAEKKAADEAARAAAAEKELARRKKRNAMAQQAVVGVLTLAITAMLAPLHMQLASFLALAGVANPALLSAALIASTAMACWHLRAQLLALLAWLLWHGLIQALIFLLRWFWGLPPWAKLAAMLVLLAVTLCVRRTIRAIWRNLWLGLLCVAQLALLQWLDLPAEADDFIFGSEHDLHLSPP